MIACGNNSLPESDSEDSLVNQSNEIAIQENITALTTATKEDNNITNQQIELSQRFRTMHITETNEMQLDLLHLLKASNCPVIMYDRIVSWLRRHESTIMKNGLNRIGNRDSFISDMNQLLYKKPATMKPIVNHVQLSSGRSTNIITFSFTEMVLKMVRNKTLFIPENLLLDPNDPVEYQNVRSIMVMLTLELGIVKL